MVYFAQFKLDADAVAMVTASHNENGWTGVKMGIKKGLTHAPEEMKEASTVTVTIPQLSDAVASSNGCSSLHSAV